MGKIPLNKVNFDDFDDIEYFESKRDTKQKAKNGKHTKNDYDEELFEPQGVSASRGEGDSYISKRRKARS